MNRRQRTEVNTPWMWISVASLFSAIAISASAEISPAPALALNGSQVTAGRLDFTVGSNGLPAQISIRAETNDLPLEARGTAVKMTDADLVAIGRGMQLAAPMRVEAKVQGKAVVLSPVEPAKPVLAGEGVTCKAKLAGGGVTATIDAEYGLGGALTVKLVYGGGAKVESLALVTELNGAFDTIVSGGAPFKAGEYDLAADEGTVWGNAAPAASPPGGKIAAVNRGAPGVPAHLYWGNGDRGFTWLGDAAGWTVVPAAPTMMFSREKDGTFIWRALLVNQPAELKAEKTVTFTLLTHPSASRAADCRKAEWLAWPFAGKVAATPALTAAARKGVSGLVRADSASICESWASGILLDGPAGGAALSATNTLADTYPLALFRYLAGTHTGLGARLNSNSAKLIRPGMNPASDRMALGRALMHDIGVEPTGLAHLVMASRVVKALADFGCFEADGKTEFVPYWRSRKLARYGEEFTQANVFEETTVDPTARIHVSVWRRPAPEGKKGTRALILVVNEGDQPVREQFYVLDPTRLFGGANDYHLKDAVARWDMEGIPEDGSWSPSGLSKDRVSLLVGNVKADHYPVLVDAEDYGFVPRTAAKGNQEVYDRLFIPAKGFRLIMGGANP